MQKRTKKKNVSVREWRAYRLLHAIPDRLELVGEVLRAGGRGVEAVAHTNEHSTREYTLIHGRGVHAKFKSL